MGLWRPFVRSLLVVCGRILSFLLSCIPEAFIWCGSSFCAVILFDVFRFRRKIILKNLEIVFPDLTHQEKHKIARRSLGKLVYNFYEFCLFPVIDDSWIQDHTEFLGLENLDKALMKNKGVLLLSLHLGHGDMAISMLAHKGYSLNVISKHFKMKWLNDFWFGARKRFGANFMDPHGKNSSFDILRCLKKNQMIIFVLDQYMGPPYGIKTHFFGKPTGTAYGLALFSIKTGAPVVPIWSYRNKEGKNIIEVGMEISTIIKSTREDSLLATTQSYNSILEHIIQKHPDDWMWIHRRWKKFRSDLPENSIENSL